MICAPRGGGQGYPISGVDYDWCCPDAKIDFTVGGKFSYRMEAKDRAMGFDFEGKFTFIDLNKRIEYTLDNNRKVSINFLETEQGIRVVDLLEAEDKLSAKLCR